MTSNSQDRDSASSSSSTSSTAGADGRSSGSPVTGPTAAGPGAGAAPAGRPVTPPAGRLTPSTPSTPATPQAAPSTAPSAGTREARRGTGEQGNTTAGTKGKGNKGAGRKSSSGGDWNVFRTVVVLVGLVIAGFGAYYLILGTAGLPDVEADPVNPTLENQFRFFSAMMVGVGAAFITIAIKFQWANMLWLVCLMVFVGGIGRVLSWAFSGTPNYVLIILMVIELAFPPALLVWHKYIAKTAELRKEFAQRD